MSNTLSHESTLLKQELGRFALPQATEGGELCTATVLWQQLTLDPVHTSAAALGYMSHAIHAKLVKYGEGAELVPDLAERWEVLEAGLVYRFHLRRGVRFHNGRQLVAKDVHDTYVRLLAPEFKSSGQWILRTVRGAKDVIEGRSKQVAGIVVRDDYTVDIELEEPLAFFLSLLTMHEAAIVPSEEARDLERFRTKAIGAGAFKLKEWRRGDRIVLERNDSYWRNQVALDEVVLIPAHDQPLRVSEPRATVYHRFALAVQCTRPARELEGR